MTPPSLAVAFRRLEWHCFHFALFMAGVEREHLTAYAAGLYVVHRVFTLQLSAPVAYKWLLQYILAHHY
ncbi:hypothetical protein OUZ56_014011 [Daphnia magna]|uniref:Uncharacterized protein n=1 Tax=Daphnia magna TaxID=35525 RepID=A0ABQ9Z899_9CRUS|nr:hypothetical protein OUZ56_014011 [Daphnia magna]